MSCYFLFLWKFSPEVCCQLYAQTQLHWCKNEKCSPKTIWNYEKQKYGHDISTAEQHQNNFNDTELFTNNLKQLLYVGLVSLDFCKYFPSRFTSFSQKKSIRTACKQQFPTLFWTKHCPSPTLCKGQHFNDVLD